MSNAGSGSFGVVQGRYELEEIVGSGGMGVVYRARDRVLGRTVAVKMIRQELAGEEFSRRFEREAAILARIRSPHIVVVYDYGQEDDQFYMVTDFLTEGDLAGWLERNGAMPVKDAVPLVAKLADGLADAHDLGVLHRDIKPANVLLWTRSGKLHPVLADFGIAVTSDLTLTKTGAVVGSPLYMAPERHVGEPATVASDIYSMGCLLYALTTGEPPYWGTEFQAANAHLNSPIPKIPADLPFASEVDEVITACMAKNPADRIASADDLAEQLRMLATEISPPKAAAVRQTADVGVPSVGKKPAGGATTVLSPTYPPPPPGDASPGSSPTPSSPSPSGSGRSRGLVALVAVVAVVALVSVGGWLLTRDDDPATDSSGSADRPDERCLGRGGSASKGAGGAAGEAREWLLGGHVRGEGSDVARRRRVRGRTEGRRLVARAGAGHGADRGRRTGRVRHPPARCRQRVRPHTRAERPVLRRGGAQGRPGQPQHQSMRVLLRRGVHLLGHRAGRFPRRRTGHRWTYVPHAPGFDDPDPKVKQIPVDSTGFGILGAHNEPGGERYDGGVKLDPRAESITITAGGITRDIDLAASD